MNNDEQSRKESAGPGAPVSRRSFMGMTLSAVGSTLLAACGVNSSVPPDSSRAALMAHWPATDNSFARALEPAAPAAALSECILRAA